MKEPAWAGHICDQPQSEPHPLEEPRPPISVIVVHHRQPEVLGKMLDSLAKQNVNFEVLVANASPATTLEGLPVSCRVLAVDNRGYGRAVNQALEHASGQIIALCNSDVVLRAGCLSSAVQFLKRHGDVGVVAGQLVNVDGSLQYNARRFYTWLDALWARCPLRRFMSPPAFFSRYLMADEPCNRPRDVDWLIGALLVVRREALAHPNRAFDPRYRFYMEDVDFCLDMWQRGWRIVQVPEIMASHLHGRASRRVLSRAGFHHFASFVRFLLKHRGLPQRTT